MAATFERRSSPSPDNLPSPAPSKPGPSKKTSPLPPLPPPPIPAQPTYSSRMPKQSFKVRSLGTVKSTEVHLKLAELLRREVILAPKQTSIDKGLVPPVSLKLPLDYIQNSLRIKLQTLFNNKAKITLLAVQQNSPLIPRSLSQISTFVSIAKIT